MPATTPLELASAIRRCIESGARVVNLSLAVAQPFAEGERALEEALNQAARRGAIIVAAAGNQRTLASSAITRHPWVIPVVACDLHGRPLAESNLGGSIGRRGLRAPGEGIASLSSENRPFSIRGTSVAAPFVTGAVALLWSEFPQASAQEIKLAITRTATAAARQRASVVPPLLDAAAAFKFKCWRMGGDELYDK